MVVYVDDILFSAQTEAELQSFQDYLQKPFKLKVAKDLEQFLGFEMEQLAHGVKLHTAKYMQNSTIRFRLPIQHGDKGIMTNTEYLEDKRKYQSLLGIFNFITNRCRPDVRHAVNLLARNSQNPTKYLFDVAKQVLVYLNSTRHLGLRYGKCTEKKHMLESTRTVTGAVNETENQLVGISSVATETISHLKLENKELWLYRVLRQN